VDPPNQFLEVGDELVAGPAGDELGRPISMEVLPAGHSDCPVAGRAEGMEAKLVESVARLDVESPVQVLVGDAPQLVDEVPKVPLDLARDVLPLGGHVLTPPSVDSR
jgi:hypothetical protein